MRRWLGLLAAAVLAAVPSAAQDGGLLPDVSAVFGVSLYEAVVGEVLHRDPAVCRGGVQMIALPAFTPERSAGTCQTQDGFVAYAVTPSQSIGYAGTDTTGVEPWSPERARAVAIHRDEVRIDSALAARVAAVWARTLRTARQPPESTEMSVGLDGEIVHFASFAPVMLAANAWSPDEASLPGALAALGGAIRAVALRRAPAGALAEACARLEAMLASETNP